jgi:ribosome-associated toxin RatA of RatAB toxin-antitoxin module
MIRCEIQLEVDRPPSVAFAFVDDVTRAPLWLSRCAAIEQTSPPPKRVGTTLHYTYKEGTGPKAMDGTVTAYEKDRVLTMRFADPMFDVEVGFRFEPAGAGTRIDHAVTITPKSGMMKIMAPMIRMATRKQIAQDTARLKQLLESGS